MAPRDTRAVRVYMQHAMLLPTVGLLGLAMLEPTGPIGFAGAAALPTRKVSVPVPVPVPVHSGVESGAGVEFDGIGGLSGGGGCR